MDNQPHEYKRFVVVISNETGNAATYLVKDSMRGGRNKFASAERDSAEVECNRLNIRYSKRAH